MTYSQDHYARHSEDILLFLIKQMNALSARIQEDVERYKQRVDSSADQGFMIEYTNALNNKYRRLLQHVESMEDAIEMLRQEVAWQQQEIRDLQAAAQRSAD